MTFEFLSLLWVVDPVGEESGSLRVEVTRVTSTTGSGQRNTETLSVPTRLSSGDWSEGKRCMFSRGFKGTLQRTFGGQNLDVLGTSRWRRFCGPYSLVSVCAVVRGLRGGDCPCRPHPVAGPLPQ